MAETARGAPMAAQPAEETRIEALLPGDAPAYEAAVAILVDAFGDPARYDEERIRAELVPAAEPFYRRFFVARRGDEVVGIGGVKAADWASNTHILYLSAVAERARGQGVAKALIETRMAWVSGRFGSGRLLVSTARRKRFANYGFRPCSEDAASGRTMMVLDFEA